MGASLGAPTAGADIAAAAAKKTDLKRPLPPPCYPSDVRDDQGERCREAPSFRPPPRTWTGCLRRAHLTEPPPKSSGKPRAPSQRAMSGSGPKGAGCMRGSEQGAGAHCPWQGVPVSIKCQVIFLPQQPRRLSAYSEANLSTVASAFSSIRKALLPTLSRLWRGDPRTASNGSASMENLRRSGSGN